MAESDQKTSGHIAYALYAISIVVGFTAIAGVIFCYLKRSAYADALWQGHMTWLIRTFWISLLIFLVSLPLLFLFIGSITMLMGGVWFIYRVVKGWIFWNDGRAFENPESFV